MSTAYELACGCIDRTECGGVRVTLWKEHNVYHVRAHSFAKHRRISWEVFRLLPTARKAYRRAVRELIPC